MKETIIISLGGSIIYPSEKGYDDSYLRKFCDIIQDKKYNDNKFAIIIGGGYLARKYQTELKEKGITNPEELDMIGIKATRENANFVKDFFGKEANIHPEIIKDYSQAIDLKKKILLGGGWKPGCSTDYDAVLIAEKLRAKKLINLSNVDYVCDKDPKKHSDAKKIEKISWDDFRKIVGNEWDPGKNAPFDPIASKKAQELGLTVIIANGKKIENIKKILDDKNFKGTTIS